MPWRAQAIRIRGPALFVDMAQSQTMDGQLKAALASLQSALDINRELGNKAGEALTLNNISQVYDARGDYDAALKYLEDSLKIAKEIGDKAGEATTLNNIGSSLRCSR